MAVFRAGLRISKAEHPSDLPFKHNDCEEHLVCSPAEWYMGCCSKMR